MNFIKQKTHRWRLIASVLIIAALLVLARGVTRRKQVERPPTLHGDAALAHLKEQGTFGSLAEAMAAARYQIHASPVQASQSGTPGAPFYANNPSQQLHATFAPEEVRISAASNKPDGKTADAELRLQLAGYGYGDRLEPLAKGEITANGDRITIRKSAIEEWYVNKPEGLEQGFTLAAPPVGRRSGEWLRVALAIGDDWNASLRGDQQGALFERQSDGLRLGYDHLTAYDALGRTLPARMELADGMLALLVDDGQAAYPLTIDPIITQQRKLTAADAAAGDQFGAAVALSGNTAVIGAPFDDVTGTDQGSAYVFVRSGTSWSPQQKLIAADGATGDQFGFSVALSGDTVVVGANADDIGANADQGSAYVFTRSGTVWTQQPKITANDSAAGDQFGFSVALSGDTVVVGALFDDSGGNADQGSAYVFTRGVPPGGAAWAQQQKLTASDGAAADIFGISVALSGDTVVVGASGDDIGANPNQGSAYVFVRSGTNWSQQQQLLGNNSAANDNFGRAVAISGDTAAIGAPLDDVGVFNAVDQGSVYTFGRAGTNWQQGQRLSATYGAAGDLFGQSVALGGDTMVVGAPGDVIDGSSNQGAAYVFSRGAGWSEHRHLFTSDGQANDLSGIAVALSGDTVLVGTPNNTTTFAGQGAAYVFVIGGNNLVQQQRITAPDGAASDHFGHAVAISGDTVVVGIPEDDDFSMDQGSAYVFIRSGGTWQFQQALVSTLPHAGDAFGFSVAISGNTIAVGAKGENSMQGATYIYTRTGNTWNQQTKITPADGAAGDFFGYSAALNGNTLVVGAQGDDIGANAEQGSAYVFTRSGTSWIQQVKLIANDGAFQDLFGHAVAFSGDTVVVGAPTDDIVANANQGSAYIFTRSGTTWTQQQKLSINDGAAGDAFGTSVAINGDLLVVGAPFDDIGAKVDQGSAYIFARTNNGWVLQPQQLLANDGASVDDFGYRVAISGDTILVSALLDDILTNFDQGSAYVFNRVNMLWLQQKLIANGGAAGDEFGSSIAISGDTVVVGALFDTIDANSAQGSAFIFVCPACPTVTLSPASLSDVQLGVQYSENLSASSTGGGSGPYQFSLSEGTLPPGLTLAQDGRISGTPTAAGVYRFAVTATTLSSLCPGSRNYTLTVSAGTCPTLTLNPPAFPAGQSGVVYGQTMSVSGGAGPYSFTLSAGALPTGLSLFSLPGGGVLTGTATVAGVFNFTIQATDANGCLGERNYALTINGGGGGVTGLQFYPLAHPVRLLDTRAGQMGCFTPGTPISGGASRIQPAQGVCDGLNIPANAKAITGNITTVNSGGGYLTLYPSNAQQPLVANSNYQPNEIVNNVFTVGLGNDGAFKIFALNTTDIVVDVTGYYAPPGAANSGGLYFHPLPKPIRLLETRPGQTGCTTRGTPLFGNTDTLQQARLTCDGVTIPAAAAAIVGNATTVGPQGIGYLTLFPANAARPLVASSNYSTNQVVNGPFTVGLSAAGEFNIYTQATTHLVVDVLGYYSSEANDVNGTGLLFNPLSAPVRLLETRPGLAGCFTPGVPLTANAEQSQLAHGDCQGETIPAAARAIVGNATVVNAQGGFLTFWPSNAARPLVATSNFNAGQVFNRHFLVGLGPDGAFKMYSQLQTDLVVDVAGYFAP